jgi:hypothetical protein
MTMSPDGQRIEDLLAHLAKAAPAEPMRTKVLEEVDRRLASRDIPYDEWEVLFRERLQVERDLLTGIRPGTAGPAHPAGQRRPIRGLRVADPVGLVAAVVGLALMALNAVLVLAERRSQDNAHDRDQARARHAAR